MRRGTARIRLLLEILIAYPGAWWLMRRDNLPSTLAVLRRNPRAVTPSDKGELLAAVRLGHATVRVLDRLPTDSRCLIRSLVLTRLLDRRGIASVLVLGVKPGGQFAAHAWLEVARQPVLDPGDESFTRLAEL